MSPLPPSDHPAAFSESIIADTIPGAANRDPALHVLQIVSVTLALGSVLAALVAFYWFMRMRRSFRQDLIMLLIQSDMWKAFWLMLSPIVYFTHGEMQTKDTFCQISGFFLTASIQASDIAVLMIALHTALYIFYPQRADGENGLYPHRHYAYALWFLGPLILAGIVPMTGGHFVDTGPNCYLPTRPLWYRTALSWTPRYVIFGIIAFTYGGVYLYVGCRFRSLQEAQRRASSQSSASQKNTKRKHHRHSIPPTPSIFHHGLLQPSPRTDGQEAVQARQQSVNSTISTLRLEESTAQPAPALPARSKPGRDSISFSWLDVNYDGATRLPNPHNGANEMVGEEPSPTTTEFLINIPEIPSPELTLAATEPYSCQALRDNVGEEASPKATEASQKIPASPMPEPALGASGSPPCVAESHSNAGRRKTFSSRRPSTAADQGSASNIMSLVSLLRRGPSKPPNQTGSGNSTPICLSLSPGQSEGALQKSRNKMRRQLRLLFVYPLVYMLTWVAPMVSHVMGYDDDMGRQAAQPFPLLIASIGSLCIGAAVDCCFFCAWEKPWRYLARGFWEGVKFRGKFHPDRKLGGRTKEEQLRDATSALDRRAHETAEEEAEARIVRTRPARVAREWWDALDEDD